MEEPKAHIQPWKKEKIKEIEKLLEKYSTIAILNMQSLPSKQLQSIRSKLKDKAEIIMTKKSLIRFALEKEVSKKPKLKELEEYIGTMPALLLSELDAFSLYKILKDNQISAPAKAGQIAPEDIIVKAGPTPFAPGPILSELAAVGIKSGIEGGKVAIKQDSVVVKAGQPVPENAVNILSRLGIQPVKIGINLVVALDKDTIYIKEVLDIDADKFIADLKTAHTEALTLAVGAGIINSETIKLLLVKANNEAQSLSLSIKLEDKAEEKKEVKSEEETPKEEKEEVKEEPKPEEKVEEK